MKLSLKTPKRTHRKPNNNNNITLNKFSFSGKNGLKITNDMTNTEVLVVWKMESKRIKFQMKWFVFTSYQ